MERIQAEIDSEQKAGEAMLKAAKEKWQRDKHLASRRDEIFKDEAEKRRKERQFKRGVALADFFRALNKEGKFQDLLDRGMDWALREKALEPENSVGWTRIDDMPDEIVAQFSPDVKKAYDEYLSINVKSRIDDRKDEEKLGWRPKKLDFSLKPIYDPERMYSGAYNTLEDFQRERAEYLKHENRVNQIFGKIQSQLLSYLEQAEARASKEQKGLFALMKERVRAVKLSPYYKAGTCEVSPAFYSPDSHSINVCPNIYEYPEASLFQIITHELTHSIDPCVLSYPLKTNKAYGRKYVDFAHKVPLPPGQASQESSEIDPGISFNRHPFRKTLDCLGQNASVGAKPRDARAHKQMLLAALEKRASMGETEEFVEVRALKEALRDFPHHYVRHRACDYLPQEKLGSQLGETFADWMAGEVLNGMLGSEDPETQRKQALESTALFLNNGCSLEKPPLLSHIDSEMERLGCGEPKSETSEKAPPSGQESPQEDPLNPDHRRTHPEMKLRIEKILLQVPTIRKALGCGPAEKGSRCE